MATTKLRMQHTSLQFSDTPKQQEHDIRLLFKEGIAYPIKTGTEAGPDKVGANMNRPLLMEYAEEFNHVIHFARDNFIAVDRTIIQKGSIDRGEVFIVDNSKTKGRGHDSVMATLSFMHVKPGIGRIHQGAVHYPLEGRNPEGANWKWNKLYSEEIEQWMEQNAGGIDLAFVNGDFNMNDRNSDWAFNNDFTSLADELKAWQNTGHGPIDGFASYDKDRRVKAHSFSVLDDREEFRFSDHFVCHGVWEIEHLKENR